MRRLCLWLGLVPPMQRFATAAISALTSLYTGVRHNFTGNVGYSFTPTQNLGVTALGRAISGTMVDNHVVTIWRASDHAVMAVATITPASRIDALGYAFEVLSVPAFLVSGVEYRITSGETNGGDAWRDVAAIPDRLAVIGAIAAVYGTGAGAYPSYLGGSDEAFGPPNLYISSVGAEPGQGLQQENLSFLLQENGSYITLT